MSPREMQNQRNRVGETPKVRREQANATNVEQIVNIINPDIREQQVIIMQK